MVSKEKSTIEKEIDKIRLEAWMLENVPRLVGCTEAEVIEVLAKWKYAQAELWKAQRQADADRLKKETGRGDGFVMMW